MSELKPCPFCGIDDLRVEENDAGGTWLCCDSCHAEGPYAPPEKNAAQAWNTRRAQPEATKPAQDLGAVETHGAAAQPIGEITGISEHDGKATIGLYDFVVKVGDLVYIVPTSSSTNEGNEAKKSSIDTPEFRRMLTEFATKWYDHPGEESKRREIIKYVDAALSSPADALVAGDRCTCPSGDGSLRWPCPQHPPLPVAITDKTGPNGIKWYVEPNLPDGVNLYIKEQK